MWTLRLARNVVLVASFAGGARAAVVCPGPNIVQGVDVNHFQGSIDWNAVKASGREFAVARVSDGTTLDANFNANWIGIKNAGMIRGALQFFEPSQDPLAQANLLISAVGVLGDGDLPATLDVEVTGGQSVATIVAKIHTWVNQVTSATCKQPIIYTGPGFWNGSVGSADFTDLALWVASYGGSCPTIPTAWSTWRIWQYSGGGTVSGISGAVPLDEFNGSLGDLVAFSGLSNGTPGDVAGLVFAADKQSAQWDPTAFAGTYDVLRGQLGALPVGPGGGDEVCLGDNLTVTTCTDPALPPVSSGYWYLIRGANTCAGNGPYGFHGVHGVPGVASVMSQRTDAEKNEKVESGEGRSGRPRLRHRRRDERLDEHQEWRYADRPSFHDCGGFRYPNTSLSPAGSGAARRSSAWWGIDAARCPPGRTGSLGGGGSQGEPVGTAATARFSSRRLNKKRGHSPLAYRAPRKPDQRNL